MHSATAPPKAAEIRFVQSATFSLESLHFPLVSQQMSRFEAFSHRELAAADSFVGREQISIDAEWLDAVEQRIFASLPVDGYELNDRSAWLQPSVGEAALKFFRMASLALPNEPYIYPSKRGDLVAEFAAPRGKMTCLISPEFVLVFANAGDEIIQKTFMSSDMGMGEELRSDVREISQFLGATSNVTVEARS